MVDGAQPTPLRIAWVVPGPIDQVTGGYLYDARIVAGLRRRGHRVDVHDIGVSCWPFDLSAGRRLLEAVRGGAYAFAVVDELAHPALVAALLHRRGLRSAARGRRACVPCLVVLVHHLRCSEPGPMVPRSVARAVERLALRTADAVICTSVTTAGTVRPLLRAACPVDVIRPGLDTHAGRGTVEDPHVRREPPQPPALARLPSEERAGGALVRIGESQRPNACLRVLLVGHWTPRKGILTALGALALTPPCISLDLVGDPDRDRDHAQRIRAALRQPSLAGRVRVHGRVRSDALMALYRSADAFLLASTYEGYGMVLAEALDARLPIVATRVGAVPEVVRDGAEAELVMPGDAASMARALVRLLDDPSERSRRSILASERAQDLPTWAESVELFEDVLVRTHDGTPIDAQGGRTAEGTEAPRRAVPAS
ncbi:MAG: glycosyltransferase family 4 protein [Chloroflexi bacterium]|nr:glycosyltransferase family 4 protein [Chloroflexota bacterium]